MESFNNFVDAVSSLIWDTSLSTFGINIPFLSDFSFIVMLLLGTGFYLTLRLRFMPIWRIPAGFALLWKGRKTDGKDGEVSPFAALATALSSTVGTGNLAGVATAIAIGGPGAVFWMWMTALVGMATKYSESLLAVRYREVDINGVYKGGPMYYIKNGLGPKWKWLAILFSVGALFSAAGAGNMAQGNSIAEVVDTSFGVPPIATGLILSIAAFAIIIGGIKSIGKVASKLVPFMGVGYVIIAMIILVMHADKIPGAFGQIFSYAFSPIAAVGGFTGSVIAQAISYGVARGLFSNEAGQGSAPIAHAAAQTKDPAEQATIAMLGTFIDTIVICTMTALIILSVPGGDYQYNPAARQMEFCNAHTSVQYEKDGKMETFNFSGDDITLAKMSKEDFGKLDGEKLVKNTQARESIVENLRKCETAYAAFEGEKADILTFDNAAYAGVTDFKTANAEYAWQSDRQSAGITAAAFDAGIPGGKYIIAITLLIFAFTTILGWSYYGERAAAFLFGERAVLPFRFAWCVIVFCGAVLPVKAVWAMGDIGNGLMATPNLIAVLALSGVVVAMSRGKDDPRTVEEYDESAHAKGLYISDEPRDKEPKTPPTVF